MLQNSCISKYQCNVFYPVKDMRCLTNSDWTTQCGRWSQRVVQSVFLNMVNKETEAMTLYQRKETTSMGHAGELWPSFLTQTGLQSNDCNDSVSGDRNFHFSPPSPIIGFRLQVNVVIRQARFALCSEVALLRNDLVVFTAALCLVMVNGLFALVC